MSQEGTIHISLESFDHILLNKSMIEIINTLKRTGATVHGPIPLPIKTEKFTVIRGPHVDKASREQFEIRSSKRRLIIVPTVQTVDALMKLDLSSGVDIQIYINGEKK